MEGYISKNLTRKKKKTKRNWNDKKKTDQFNLYTQEKCFSFSHPLFHIISLSTLSTYRLRQVIACNLFLNTCPELKSHSELLFGICVYEQPRHRATLCLNVNAFFPEFLLQGFTFSSCSLEEKKKKIYIYKHYKKKTPAKPCASKRS